MRTNEAKLIVMAGTPVDINKHDLVPVRKGGRILITLYGFRMVAPIARLIIIL